MLVGLVLIGMMVRVERPVSRLYDSIMACMLLLNKCQMDKTLRGQSYLRINYERLCSRKEFAFNTR